MAHKAIPLETRNCKGCGVEFQTTDPRKWFHHRHCGRGKFVKQTNAWLLANRPNFPTEPCRKCGKPVVQYRTRRYESEMRYCGRSCHRVVGNSRRAAAQWPPKIYGQYSVARVQWPPLKLGEHSRIPKGCKLCKTHRRAGLCTTHYSTLHKFAIRLRWLLPKTCLGCGEEFNRFDQGSKCDTCKRANDMQHRQLRRLRKKGDGAYEPGIDYRKLYQAGDGCCAICRRPCDDPSVWLDWDGLTWMPKAPTVDHIIALANGGTHTWNNVQLACAECNTHKGARSYPRGINGLAVVGGRLPSAESHAGTARLA
jgi:5-methylcytosine-specific restriction endonuclease McrA